MSTREITPLVSTEAQELRSQTAQDYIDAQHKLELEAREVLPYAFDTCTKPLGPLRQLVFACLSCTPDGSEPAGVCYSCSISCHGSHGELVELFAKRNFACDCGTTRLPHKDCILRKVTNEEAVISNTYNQNYHNKFCQDEPYQAEDEVGTMYQCLLGDICKEDWFHDICILGNKPSDNLTTSKISQPYTQGTSDINSSTNESNPHDNHSSVDDLENFPDEDDFEYFICWKCTSKNAWLCRLSGLTDIVTTVTRKQTPLNVSATESSFTVDGAVLDEHDTKKRKIDDIDDSMASNDESLILSKKWQADSISQGQVAQAKDVDAGNLLIPSDCQLPQYEQSLVGKEFSLFLRTNFRDRLCRCRNCMEFLCKFPCLMEEEDTYEPPLDEDLANSTAHESLLDAGEKALSSYDRIRAIEGVMAYNSLKEKVRTFLQPFAEEKRVVSAEDIKQYFEELRGDSTKMQRSTNSRDDSVSGDPGTSDKRQDQEGY